MKAWRIHEHGAPSVLRLEEMPEPVAGPMEAIVRVQAVALNHLDLWARKGIPGYRFPLPMIPGCDFAGVIDAGAGAFGPGAETALADSGIARGTPVLVNPSLSCGHCEACLSGFDPLCKKFGIFGETQDGGCRERIAVPVANLIRRPDKLTAVQAAALPIPFVTAWSMLMRKAGAVAGQTILIQAGGSGVSVAAIQIARLLGLHVMTTVGHDAKIAPARALGAEHAINYRTQALRDEARKFLAPFGKKGFDIVLDHVGADTFAESMKALAWGGKLVCCGATSGSEIKIDLKALYFKNLSLLGSTMGSKADLIRIVELVRAGQLKPVIDQVFPFAQLVAAHERLESRQAFGKVVVEIS